VRYLPIQSFDNYIEANIICARLEQEGISCWLQHETLATTAPFLANALGGIKLMVAELQIDRALELLSIFKKQAEK
jgi:putative signal transducing protein